MADTTTVETGTVDPSKNNAATNGTQVIEKPVVDNSAVEAERKLREQAEMRANQLANQLKAKEDAEAAQKAEELVEQNKFKELYEQEKARRETVEAAQTKAEQDQALKAESDKLFNEYPEQVRQLAEEAGMRLSDTDEDAIAAFKQKLDKVSSLVKQPKVTANNPGTMPTVAHEMDPNDMHAMLNNPKRFEEYLKKNTKGIASMLKQTAE